MDDLCNTFDAIEKTALQHCNLGFANFNDYLEASRKIWGFFHNQDHESRRRNFTEHLYNIKTSKTSTTIDLWIDAIKTITPICGASPHIVISAIERLLLNYNYETGYKAIEVYVRFYFYFFTEGKSYKVDTFTCKIVEKLLEKLNEDEFQHFIDHLSSEAKDCLICSRVEYNKLRENPITHIIVKWKYIPASPSSIHKHDVLYEIIDKSTQNIIGRGVSSSISWMRHDVPSRMKDNCAIDPKATITYEN